MKTISTQEEEAAAALNNDRKAALAVIGRVFVQLDRLNDIHTFTKYRDLLFKQIKEEEKTQERYDNKLTRTQRAQFYTVWRLAEFLTGSRTEAMNPIRDYLWTRKHIYIACAIVQNYPEHVRLAFASAGAKPEVLALLDFSKLNK